MMLSEKKSDVLKEIFNIGVGRAASALNELVEKKVHIEIPGISVISINEANDEMSKFCGNGLSVIEHGFNCSFSGTASLVFPYRDATKLVGYLTSKNLENLGQDSVKASVLMEVGNILINSLLGTLSNILDQKMAFTLPKYRELYTNDLFIKDVDKDRLTVICKTKFTIEEIEVEGIFFMYIYSQDIEILLAQLVETG